MGNRRACATVPMTQGGVDGPAVDAEGCYGAALFWGGAVVRFAPDGREIQRIPVRVSRPTMCSFGGTDMQTPFVSTGSWGMTAEEIEREALVGSIFWIEVNVPRLLEPRFAGQTT